MSSLPFLSALPAPLDWLSWGLLAGPIGLTLMGVGATALRLLADDEADVELAGLEASDPR
jgi:hypothetical protein